MFAHLLSRGIVQTTVAGVVDQSPFLVVIIAADEQLVAVNHCPGINREGVTAVGVVGGAVGEALPVIC